MKAAVFNGPKDLRVVEMPRPTIKPNEILVKVDYCGICGTDLSSYSTGLYVNPGQVMGHEFAGMVAEIGVDVAGLEVGKPVTVRPMTPCGKCYYCLRGHQNVCLNGFFGDGIAYGRQGAFAEYVVVPRALVGENVFPLLEKVSTMEASIIEPLSVAIHAVNQAKVGLSDTVVVFGAGTIGLCVSQVIKTIGNCHVIQVDISDLRLEVAKKLGADTVINASKEDVMERITSITGKGLFGIGASADIVFECAGTSDTIRQALESARHEGQIISIAIPKKEVYVDQAIIVTKELTWRGANAYTNEFSTALNLLEKEKINVKDLITHTYPIEEINSAFITQLDSSNSIKVIVKPS